MEFKDIHIGEMLRTKAAEVDVEISRICNFLKCNVEEIDEMYKAESLDTHLLLRWSKLLEYDFFRIYSQHLILYAPPASHDNCKGESNAKSVLPQFRKHLYTKEIIDFILGEINSGAMTRKQVTEIYKIPNSTLYKWLKKYSNT
ncbi:MAG: transposase [Chryseobacterium sp.]|uniref:transposase n=1 Tax=Chryseobacterium sp. TaxID=1871047 RepID=UPI0025B827CB|nr:transposase [Chryseobacterium sp.]MCJ7935653.1 transposase [Chryseobacterium sp.]